MDATPPPSDDPHEMPVPFAVGYRPHIGDMMVHGGGVVTLIGVVVSVLNAMPAVLLVSAIASLVAWYFSPTLELSTPQLGADGEGIYVAGIGVIGWAHVADIKVERRALRSIALARLVIDLDKPWDEALIREARASWSDRLRARNARVIGRRVRVELHTLALPPEAVERALARAQAARWGDRLGPNPST